jgi:hypothetical protein
MLPLHSTAAATTTAVLPLPPQFCLAAAVTLPPLLRCCHHRAAASAAILPPSCRHRHCPHATATAAGIAKLPLPPQSYRCCHYLHYKIGFNNEKEF